MKSTWSRMPMDLHAVQLFQVSFDLFRQCPHVDGPGKFAAVPSRGQFRGLQNSFHGRHGNSQTHGTFEVASGLPGSSQCGDGSRNCDLTEGQVLRMLGASDQESEYGHICDVCYCVGVLDGCQVKTLEELMMDSHISGKYSYTICPTSAFPTARYIALLVSWPFSSQLGSVRGALVNRCQLQTCIQAQLVEPPVHAEKPKLTCLSGLHHLCQAREVHQLSPSMLECTEATQKRPRSG